MRERFDTKFARVRTLREALLGRAALASEVTAIRTEESELQSCGEVAEELAPDEINLFAAMGQKLGHTTSTVQSSESSA